MARYLRNDYLKIFFFPLYLFVFTLSACENDVQTEQSIKDINSQYPKTIHSALGTTVIPKKPERIITLGNASEDILLSFGIMPIAIEAHHWGGDEKGYFPWFKEEARKQNKPLPQLIETYPEINIEKIIQLKPDLILATQSGLSQKAFSILSRIAPVVAYPHKPWLISMEENITSIAKILNIETKGANLIKTTEKSLEDFAQKIPHAQKYTCAYIKADTSNNNLYIYAPQDPRMEILKKLGFNLWQPTQNNLSFFNSFFANIGMESANILNNADILITWYDNEKERERTEALPLFRSIHAIENGIYIPIQNKTLAMAMAYGSPLALYWGLAYFTNILKEKIEKYENKK